MKRFVLPTLALALVFSVVLLPVSPISAQCQSARQLPRTRENFDLRLTHRRSLDAPPETATTGSEAQPPRSQTGAREWRLKRERPGAQLRWSSLTAAPSRIWSFNETLTAPQRGDDETIARRFIRDNRDLFRLGDDEVNGLRVKRRYRTDHNGVRHVTLGQQVNGLEVFQAEYAIHLDREGAVIAASGELIPEVARAINASGPKLSAAESLRIAAREAGEEIVAPLTLRAQPTGADQRQEFDRAAGFGDHVPARLVYFPLSAKQVRLAWQFIVTMRETPDVYFVMIDAERGSLLFLHNLTCYDENPLRPHGLVYTKESPRPNLPFTTGNPPVVEREDLPLRAAPFNGSTIFDISNPHYDWWAGVNADNLISNNTTVYLDRDAMPNQPDLPRLTVPDGNFSFPVDLTQSPTTDNNQKAAQVNLFYWINRYHDILYRFGFNEAAGNFQTNNFNLGGQGGDAVLGEAQDGSGTNNANFSTPPDGRPGRVQMFLWTGTPQLDGDLDQGVIIHELTHGLSNRLIGNATGLGLIQDRGMGEGWSDWFALALLANEGDALNGSYPVGQYVLNNYTRGIRRFPYSTDTTINPLTFKDVALRVEVHAIGEIWCNALWEMRALLIQKYGFREGQRQSIQLAVDGMKLTPVAPTFLDARNAIILADRVNNGGANQCLIWQAFAKRGIGFRAKTDDANDGAPVESFFSAPYCSDTGVLAHDKVYYVTGEFIHLSLGDRNAGGNVAVQITSSSTGDQETITMSPESGIAGSFLAAVRIAAGRANPGDGLLQAAAGDAIQITYNDPNSSSGGPAQVIAVARLTREKVVYEDDIERGNQGWIPTGSWAITNARAASGKRSWTDSPSGDYADNSDSSITSPLFDFTGLTEVTLSFAQSYATEDRFDLGLVEYSTDDGATWIRAASFTGAQAVFAQSRVSLRGLDNQARARIRFRLLTDAGVVADGWYIDDIRLTARSASPSSIPPNSTPAPVITSIAPAFGPPAGGTRVTIIGANFTEDETTSVTFDGVPAASVSVFGGAAIAATTPAHAAGAATVRVVNRNGAASFVGGFTYHTQGSAGGAPTLTALFPASGSARGGTPVTVIGANFTPETQVTFGGRAATVTFINANTLRVLTPMAAALGTVAVTASNGSSQTSLANAFNYTAPSRPTVEILSPAGGETWFARSVVNLRWRSSDNRAVARHRISLFRSAGPMLPALIFVADIATNLDGEAQSFTWTIPANIEPTNLARIRFTAIDDEGEETDVVSLADFTLARRWESSALLPAALQRLQAASDGKFLYAIGGRSTTANSSTVAALQRLDPAAGAPAWTSAGLAPMPTGINSGEAVFLKGRIYIPGGVNPSNQVTRLHLAYDVATNAWTMPAQPPSAAIDYALAADEERGVFYLTGGSPNGQSGVTTVRSYDPNGDAWTDLPPMSTARFGHEAALIHYNGGKLYVAGGLGATGALASGEVYDFNTRQWSPIAPLNRPRLLGVNFAGKDPAGNPLWFIVGGQAVTGGAPLAGAEVYDVRNNRWIALDDSFNLPTPRAIPGGATLGGFFYAVGGATPTVSNRATERMRLDLLTPIPLDQAPVLAVPAAQIAVANHEIKFTVSSNDLGSGVPLTITASGLPAGARFTTANVTNNSVRGSFSWTPSPADTGRTFDVIFTASDGQLSDTKAVNFRVVTASPLAAVNAADFRPGPLAADSIAAAFGTNLAVRTEVARELPLPTELAGTTLTVNGVPAPLFFVSSQQINFAVPSSVDLGSATIIAGNPVGGFAVGDAQIAATAPAIFTANAAGTGDAAALATPDGIVYQQPPFDVLVNGRPNILILFCTGIRRAQAANPNDDDGVAEAVSATIGGQNARALYAGAQGAFAGLDQINVEMPASLAGGGQRRVEVVVTVNGVAANRVTIQIK